MITFGVSIVLLDIVWFWNFSSVIFIIIIIIIGVVVFIIFILLTMYLEMVEWLPLLSLNRGRT